MKLTLTTMLSLTALLAACGQKAEKDEAATINIATEIPASMGGMAGNMSGDMGNMSMPAQGAAKMAKGDGTVTAIDNAAGTVTLHHGPIPEAKWPAMTMAFKAKPELLDSLKVGDKVAFDLAIRDGAGEVIAIRKR